jgi:hypothetical protein
MSLTLEIPPPLDEELSEEAERAGIPAAEHATLLLYLANALSNEERPAPFKEAVRAFLTHHSLDADHVTSVFEQLVRLCLTYSEDQGSSRPREMRDALAERDFALLKQWRNALVHGVNGEASSSSLSPPTGSPGQSGKEQASSKPERDADLAARVRGVRGKFARVGGGWLSDELHRERQSDKEKEERPTRGNGA